MYQELLELIQAAPNLESFIVSENGPSAAWVKRNCFGTTFGELEAYFRRNHPHYMGNIIEFDIKSTRATNILNGTHNNISIPNVLTSLLVQGTPTITHDTNDSSVVHLLDSSHFVIHSACLHASILRRVKPPTQRKLSTVRDLFIFAGFPWKNTSFNILEGIPSETQGPAYGSPQSLELSVHEQLDNEEIGLGLNQGNILRNLTFFAGTLPVLVTISPHTHNLQGISIFTRGWNGEIDDIEIQALHPEAMRKITYLNLKNCQLNVTQLPRMAKMWPRVKELLTPFNIEWPGFGELSCGEFFSALCYFPDLEIITILTTLKAPVAFMLNTTPRPLHLRLQEIQFGRPDSVALWNPSERIWEFNVGNIDEDMRRPSAEDIKEAAICLDDCLKSLKWKWRRKGPLRRLSHLFSCKP
ncbi:hypothetical protein M422DRAFT_274276 [Sphaerobolus stellatus SS14]|uniref:Uncharacterized protein n=1 Tax=Sphaerobolus stellatus (strain SS14) TaxID=990650 RepID=A0A0C9UHH9_SPHS4|nr:hypothetical protein M422DRAFT_274276 [Sphaerobolus stellatus SS14]